MNSHWFDQQQILIPLESRTLSAGLEEYQIDLELDDTKKWEIAVSSLYFIKIDQVNKIGFLSCDAIDSSVANPKQIITQICRTNNEIQSLEFYKIDRHYLRFIRLDLSDTKVSQLAVTLIIRQCHGQKTIL